MAKYEDQIGRMKELMNYGSIVNETTEAVNSGVEFFTEGGDGKIYGIIRENKTFVIKVADKDKELVKESFSYIGGITRKKDNQYHSYNSALKQLEFKMRSINESIGLSKPVEFLNPLNKEQIIVENRQEFVKELNRQREIMRNSMIIGEGTVIGQNNVGLPEAPDTAETPQEQGLPFGDVVAVKNSKPNETKEIDVENVEVLDSEETNGETQKQGGNAFETEACKDGYCDLDVSKDVEPKQEDEDGEKESVTEGVEGVVGFSSEPIDFDNMSDEELLAMLQADENNETEANLSQEDESGDIDSNILTLGESVMRRIVEGVMENMSGEHDKTPKASFTPFNRVWFQKQGLTNISRIYDQIVTDYKDLTKTKDPNEVDELYQEYDSFAMTVGSIISNALNGKEINRGLPMSDILVDAIEQNRGGMIEVLNSINKISEMSASYWDNNFAIEHDKDFDEKTASPFIPFDQVDKEHANDDDDDFFGDDSGYDPTLGECKKKSIKENDFGKHPKYKKRVMTTPKGEVEGKVYGEKIGASTPYDLKVQMLTDQIMKKLQEQFSLKKKVVQ